MKLPKFLSPYYIHLASPLAIFKHLVYFEGRNMIHSSKFVQNNTVPTTFQWLCTTFAHPSSVINTKLVFCGSRWFCVRILPVMINWFSIQNTLLISLRMLGYFVIVGNFEKKNGFSQRNSWTKRAISYYLLYSSKWSEYR